jgi:hypothetical protein
VVCLGSFDKEGGWDFLKEQHRQEFRIFLQKHKPYPCRLFDQTYLHLGASTYPCYCSYTTDPFYRYDKMAQLVLLILKWRPYHQKYQIWSC